MQLEGKYFSLTYIERMLQRTAVLGGGNKERVAIG